MHRNALSCGISNGWENRTQLALALGCFILITVLYDNPLSHASHPVSLVSGVERFELENGLTVLIKPEAKARTVSVHLGLRRGSIHEESRMGSGLSHFVEHMFFKGTGRRPAGTVEKEIRDMGGQMNAYTSHDVTVYYITALSQYLEQVIDLLSDLAFHASFDEVEMEKEREVILSEMRLNEDLLDRKALITLWQTSFRKHPYRHPVIGYPSLFKRVSRSDLMDFYRQSYVPNEMVLAIVGDVDVDKARRWVQQSFESVPRGWASATARPEEPEQLTARRAEIYKEAKHSRLLFGFLTVPLNHEESPALDVLGAILGGGSSSRLNQKVKEEGNHVLEVSAFNASMDEGGIFIIQSVLLQEKVEAARDALTREIDRLKTEAIPPEELAKAKNQFLADFYSRFEDHAAISREILTNEMYTGEYRFSEKYVDKVKKLAGPDIQNAAKKYLAWHRLNETLLLPVSEKKSEVEAQNPASEKGSTQLMRLDNGLRVLLVTDPSTPTVTMQCALLGGVRFEEEDQSGISALTAKLLTKGTPSKNQSQIAQEVEAWGGAIESYSGLNSLGVSLACLSEHTYEALALLSELMRESHFPEEEFQKVKERQIEAIRAKEENIFAYAQDRLVEKVYLNHPYRRDPLGTEESLESLSREDVARFYRQVLDPRRALLAVAGDITPDIRDWILEHFQELQASADVKANPAFEEERIDDVREARSSLPREQAVVMLGFNAPRLGEESRYAYEVLNAVTGGSSGRLYRRIREEEGLSYVVNSDITLGIDPGYFAIYASVKPGEGERTLDLLRKEVEELRDHGITDEELRGAQQSLLGDYEHAMEAKGSRLTQLAAHELYGLGYEEWLKYRERIAQVALEDVHRIIEEFLDPNHAVELVIESAPAAPRAEERPLASGALKG